MSVLVKGMKMPRSCAECVCGQNGLWCYMTNRDFADDYCDVKLDDCPLVEVKEPHGRLIDADEIKEDISAEMTTLYLDGLKGTPISTENHRWALNRLDDAETVIEAE